MPVGIFPPKESSQSLPRSSVVVFLSRVNQAASTTRGFVQPQRLDQTVKWTLRIVASASLNRCCYWTGEVKAQSTHRKGELRPSMNSERKISTECPTAWGICDTVPETCGGGRCCHKTNIQKEKIKVIYVDVFLGNESPFLLAFYRWEVTASDLFHQYCLKAVGNTNIPTSKHHGRKSIWLNKMRWKLLGCQAVFSRATHKVVEWLKKI